MGIDIVYQIKTGSKTQNGKVLNSDMIKTATITE